MTWGELIRRLKAAGFVEQRHGKGSHRQLVHPGNGRVITVHSGHAGIESDDTAAKLLAVEHIGSTAVPGCAGKGIVDLAAFYPPDMLPATRDAIDGSSKMRPARRCERAGAWTCHTTGFTAGLRSFQPTDSPRMLPPLTCQTRISVGDWPSVLSPPRACHQVKALSHDICPG